MNNDLIKSSTEAIQEAFRKVRPLILEHAGSADATYKTDGSPVTEVDVAAEAQIKAFMQERFPDLPVFGEEGGYDKLPETCWLIDPIDGTKSYLENIPVFTSMAVLISDNKAVASVIYNHSTDEMYVAYAGNGAFLNGQRLDLSTLPLPDTIFCKKQVIEAIDELLGSAGVHAESAPSGAGHAYSLIAKGESAGRATMFADGYLHDYAPGALLVLEAGGSIIPILENNYTYLTRSFVACHPKLEALVREKIDLIRPLEDPTKTSF